MITIMVWDWKMLWRSGLTRRVLLAWLITLVAAMAFGYARAQIYQAAANSAVSDFAAKQTTLEKDILANTPFARMPLSANGSLVIPIPPLIDIVAGRSDLEPINAEVNMWTLTHLMFMNYQIDSPTVLAAGAFDLGFAILYLLPLLIIVLGYSTLTSERASGMEKVLQTQAIDLTRLLFARLLARGLLITAPLLVALLTMYFISTVDAPERGARLLSVAAMTITYSAFWLSVTAWISARAATDIRALQLLCVIWVSLSLLAPALVAAAGRTLYAPPSRFDLLATARRTEIDATLQRDQLLGAYAHEHPNLSVAGSGSAPAWQKGVIVVTNTVNERLEPLRERFREQLATQQQLTEQLQYVSPVIVLQRVMTALAGTDETRYLDMRRQAAEFLLSLRHGIEQLAMADQELTVENLRALPRFELVPQTLHATGFRVLRALLVIGVMSTAIGTFSRVRPREE